MQFYNVFMKKKVFCLLDKMVQSGKNIYDLSNLSGSKITECCIYQLDTFDKIKKNGVNRRH